MSLRNRLRLFFVLIVVIPMMVVGVVLYVLIANNETGKSDAQVAAKYDTALAVYSDAYDRARRAARRIARDVPFATALRRNNVEALQTRTADLQRSTGVERIVVARGANRAIVDVGNAAATFPAKVQLEVERRRSAGRLEVSTITPRQYVDRVKRATGLEVMLMREGGDVLANTLPGADRAPIPENEKGEARVGGQDYTTYATGEAGFLGERVKIAVLSPRAQLSSDVRKNRRWMYGVIAGFFILAVTFGLIISRSLQRQMGSFLEAARRLGRGDLDARVGPLDSGPELDAVGAGLDEMAARLSASLDRERAAESRRRDLVIAVSHDLRTPLAGLRAMVESIDEGVVDDPPTVRRYIAEMRRSVDSLVVLVDDLFELVQLDAGALVTESERARLEDVVHSAVAACDAQAAEKGLALETKLNGAGAAHCSPRIARVIQNLLQNAIRHTPADGTVRVQARRRLDRVEVVVEDSGEGIGPEALERVFDPFWRGDAARSSPGAGLGLALAKRIVEALGGTIAVESEPARGSRFAIQFPYAS
jgi:signal transduction histidine kinase